jgi:hypothetical protein
MPAPAGIRQPSVATVAVVKATATSRGGIAMIKHIVFFRLKDQAHGNTKAVNAQLFKQKLEALRGIVPGLLTLEVGIDVSGTEMSADVALYSEFASKEALEAYIVHPAHQAVLPFLAEARTERRLCDYEV